MIRSVARLAAAIAVLLVVGVLTAGCVVHGAPASPPVTVTQAVPAPPVPPDGPSTLTRPVGDWIVTNDELGDYKLPGQFPHDEICAHPGHLNGEQIAVRIDHAVDPAGTPCPQGMYPGKADRVFAGWIVSDPNSSAVDGAFATVTCVNKDLTGQLSVLIDPEQRALFHLGDPCPEGAGQLSE